MTTETRRELSPRYEPAAVEPQVYERWLQSGAFTPAPEPPPGAERFVIIMPPPNVTGALHNGHALFVALQDAMTRYHRMRGDDTLWLPGVDHASIAAQFVLDGIIAREGETRASLGRERYLERMWQFMDETRGVIGRQMHRLGASADWTRERFTMDPVSARAVRVAFKRLYDAGLAYRGEALVNWCPRCQTTISDLENVHRDETGTLWTVRYHLVGEDGAPDPQAWISVATTRPETILGDTAVAVHPDDERYRPLVGREAIIPFVNRRIPIIADDVVERGFGTGAVKITPAHDPDDYEMGKRHGLPMVNVLDGAARMSDVAGDLAGLDRYDARREIVARLAAAGDLEGERQHAMVIGHCQRCGTVVEPRLSVQWFLRTRPLAEVALASVREGRTRLIPDHFEKVYAHWMENIHDWAVGRQLWWGHRIPAWYCPDGHITVSDAEDGPDACDACGRPASELTHETDIFDTWFSSGLWPFSTLGWPDETPDYRRFYPTSVMETAPDIIFFWVARMMMLGLYFTGVEPFHTVYFHGLVRADGGVKMSKTKGNVVDPLEVAQQIGADALRFALVAGTAPGSDQQLTSAKLDGARNFATKLWNAARFVIGARPGDLAAPEGEPTLAERWIRSRLAAADRQITRQLDELDMPGYAAAVHELVWADFCDWFIEMVKVDLRREGASAGERSRVWLTAAESLAHTLRLLHPIMPFATEQVWGTLHELEPRATNAEPMLITAAWPAPVGDDPGADEGMALLREATQDVRDLRLAQGIAAGEWRPATLVVGSEEAAAHVADAEPYLAHFWRARPLAIASPGAEVPAGAFGSNTRLGVVWFDAGEQERERAAARATARRRELEQQIERIRALVDGGDFAAKAPPAVVQRERQRLRDLEQQLRRFDEAAGRDEA
jgi:valyl-tRNA synthetase